MKLFLDSARVDDVYEWSEDPWIDGFTTNPSLMRAAGITDYRKFAKDLIGFLSDKRPSTCLSLEVFADDESDIVRQATEIASWSGEYPVYVKIPITNTEGTMLTSSIKTLSYSGIRLNVTAIMTSDQIRLTIANLPMDRSSIVSIFAGRIDDLGHDSETMVRFAKRCLDSLPYNGTHQRPEILWASSREARSYKRAQSSGADIITMTPDLVKKVREFGYKTLETRSLETVREFREAALASGYTI